MGTDTNRVLKFFQIIAPVSAAVSVVAFWLYRRHLRTEKRKKYASFCVLLHNVSKLNNMGSIVRSAAALGASEVICVGVRKVSELSLFGAHCSRSRIPIRCFQHAKALQKYLSSGGPTGDIQYEFVGIEIDPGAVSVNSAEFSSKFLTPGIEPTISLKHKRICFLPGNEGTGLSQQDRKMCDWFCYIPQHSEAIASLNVGVAVAIVLQRAAVVTHLPEVPRQSTHEDKYTVRPPRSTNVPAPFREDLLTEAAADAERIRAWRRQAVEENNCEQEDDVNEGVAELFSPCEPLENSVQNLEQI